MQYYIKKCSVVDIDADIIVNAANCNLLPGGGVCEAIFAKAGEEELLKECKEYGYVNMGQVAVTKGYNTGAKIIIHAVGPAKLLHPDWENLLEMLYRNILYTADDSGLESIAIPCISVGHCGCPLLESTLIAMKVVRDFTPSNLKYCYLCCYTNKEQYTYQVVDCMLKHNISFTEFYNSEQFLLTHISRTKNKYIIFKNNAIYDDNNQPLHKYLFAGCVLSIDVAKYKDIAHTSNLFKTEYDSKEDRLYTYSTAIQDCLQKHNMTIDDYNTYETFIVDQINNTPSKCLALGGAVNMYSIENPDEYTPIFTNLSGKDFDMYMAVSMSSALFYTGPGNMERFISIRETFDTIGLFLYPSKYRRFYPDHNIDCKKYNHIIKNIYRRFHIYHDKTLLQATDNIKELSIYEVATNTLTCTLDDITPIIENPTHPSLYQLKYKDRSKFILTDKDACVVASSPWVLTITYEETIPTSITTIEQLYNNLIATINNMTPDLRVAQNIPFWKKTTKYNNIIDEFKYLF
ncbi:MAG: macro domain-containing protein, partial [Clostridia bacterium]|nr:macro domain-containing protein [Clostridia bacterium]